MSGDFELGSAQRATFAAAHQSLNGATLCAWIQPESPTVTGNIINITGSTTGLSRFSLNLRSADSKVGGSATRANGDTATVCVSNTVLTAGTIYFIAVSADYIGSRIDVYVVAAGGTLSAADNSTTGIAGWGTASDANASSGGAIGSRADGNSATLYDGRVQDARFYQRALSLADLQDVYAGGPGGAAPRNQWMMGATSGTMGTITDDQGNNNATAVNSPVYAANIRQLAPAALTSTTTTNATATRALARSQAGSATATGAEPSRALARSQAGSATATGAEPSRALARSQAGSATATGAEPSRALARVNAGAIATSCEAVKGIAASRSATVTAAGADPSRALARSETGSVTTTGALARALGLVRAATVSATGTVARAFSRAVAALVSLAASVAKIVTGGGPSYVSETLYVKTRPEVETINARARPLTETLRAKTR